MNKYQRIPGQIIDLHRLTVKEAEAILIKVVAQPEHKHVRIITGKGLHGNGPILKTFVKDYLQRKGIKYSQAKIQDGGEGALEVFLK